jgi:penicillin-binding protein 1C
MSTPLLLKHAIKKVLYWCAVATLAIVVSGVILNKVFPLPDNIEYSTVVTDNRGDIIHVYLTADDKWRIRSGLDDISPLLKKTIIYKEDRHFYVHFGINPFSIVRAVVNNTLQGKRTSGASTITMQVARALQPKRRTYANKMIEIFRALQIEWKYSKDEILNMYCNLLPYGGNIEGMKAASLLYFGKEPDHLSLAEITALSIIPNRPSTLVIGKNNAAIEAERNKWLKRFEEDGFFTANEIADAVREPLTATRKRFPTLAPHLAARLKREGTVRTKLNMKIQSTTEKIVADYCRPLERLNIRNAAVVIIDNTTHEVVAYLGSDDFYDSAHSGQVNGATALRQPGSTLKPLLYAMLIDNGTITPKSIVADVPINYEGYAPENYDKQFNGNVSVEYALEHSLNIPAVRGLSILGVQNFVDALSLAGFRQIQKDRKKLGLSMVLGGCGATLEELTALFSVFANEGMYYPPSYVDAQTKKPFRLISKEASFMINETLSKVARPDFPINWQSTERMPKIAWKTGTSYGRRDAWSIGYNKKYTVGVWTGNFSGLGIPELTGSSIATPLLFKIFNAIDYDSGEGWYTMPDGCGQRIVCAETGLPPEEHCTQLVSDYFVPLVSSSRKCNNKTEMMISADQKFTFCEECRPESGYRKKWMTVYSPELVAYFNSKGLAYEKVPSHNPACERIFRKGVPTIVSPRNGFEYLISKTNPEPLQLSCDPSSDASRVYWYINDRFYKSSDPAAKQFFVPEEGPVKISCSDDKGRNKDVWIRVRYVDG